MYLWPRWGTAPRKIDWGPEYIKTRPIFTVNPGLSPNKLCRIRCAVNGRQKFQSQQVENAGPNTRADILVNKYKRCRCSRERLSRQQKHGIEQLTTDCAHTNCTVSALT